eukprot:TRINITY_DN122461_c0_g1_i1.p1 TRINITY_DN122461_c0_g1~~TRINITY_DN122461_c0_g1_i1.p1  ORF type:complete len:474 (-),score=39.32 TRINITY_DN122461_c0_g1_i1:19-1440(-)
MSTSDSASETPRSSMLCRAATAIAETCQSIGDRVHLARSCEDDHHVVHPGMTVGVCVILAFVYYQGVREVYQGSAPTVASLLFVLFLISGLAMIVAIQVDSHVAQDLSEEDVVARRWRGATGFLVLTFVWTMIVQFQLYMAFVAWQYPYACDLMEVHGRGANVTTWRGGAWLQLDVQSTESLTDAGGFDWDVECNDSVRVLGNRGGRETFALLSHLVPFVFVMLYVMGIGPKLGVNFAAMVIDFVDIQDFFAILLDDNMLLAYWDKGDVYDATGVAPEGGRLVWILVFTWFVIASIYISMFPIIKVLSVPHANLGVISSSDVETPIDRPAVSPTTVGGSADSDSEDPKAPRAREASALESHGRCCGYEVRPACASRLESVLSLFMIEIPFFILRIWCSMRMRIIVSSLLMKNMFSIIYDSLSMISGGFHAKKSDTRNKCWLLEPLFDVAERMHEFFTDMPIRRRTSSAGKGAE